MNKTYCILTITFLLITSQIYAKKPDSALPSNVWKTEKELLASLENADNCQAAYICLKMARIFKDNERELKYLDMAEKYARQINSKTLEGTIDIMRIEHYSIYEDTGLFQTYSEEVRKRMLARKDRRSANIEHIIIKRNIDEGRTQTALAIADKMLKRANIENNTYLETYAYFSLGLIYEATRQFYEAVNALEHSLALMSGISDEIPMIDKIKVYLELLSSQYSLERYGESLKSCSAANNLLSEYLIQNSEFQEEANRKSMRLYILCHFAKNHLALNNTESSRRYLDMAKECIYPSIGPDLEIFHETSAMYYMHIKEYDKAIEYINKSVLAFENEHLFPYYLNALSLKTNILAQKGEWEKAYTCLAYINHAEDSLNAFRLARELNELHTIYKVEKIETQKERQQAIIFFSSICCILLTLIIIIFILYSHRLKTKNQILYEQINSNLKNKGEATKVLQMTPEDTLSKEMLLFKKIAIQMEAEYPFTDPAFNRSSLAKIMCTNDKYIADAVRAGAGVTVATYISDHRLDYSLNLLTDEEHCPLDEVAIRSGFGSYSSFFRAFQKKYSISPSEYRNFHIHNSN